jgi:primosomal protein N' (replication factor Y) (superfamily II helicase)
MSKLYSVAFPTKNKFEGINTFVYSSTLELSLGDLVTCQFGKKEKFGVIVELNPPKPRFKLKEISGLAQKRLISNVSIKLSSWISSYYAAGAGCTLELFCTNNLINRIASQNDSKWLNKELEGLSLKKNKTTKLNTLNKEQSSALKTISSSKKQSFILHGATGSGKTEVYLHVAKEILSLNKSVLILVPEIGLTTQNIARFETLGAPLITLHSGQTPVARAKSWQLVKILTSQSKPIVVLGPRSAMFCPILNLGLTIIDEFHDQSYKQDSTPKYNSIIVGGMLAKLTSSKLILGSATPNVSDLHTLTQKDVPVLKLKARKTQTKEVSLIDSRNKDNFTKSKIISTELIEGIRLALSSSEQTMIFHNRRGSARMQLCSSCNWIDSCPSCHIPLVFHADEYKLRCHTCGFKSKPELLCPICQSEALSLRGYGTKQIVSELEKIFPDARIARFDADNTTKDSTLENNFQKLKNGQVDIIVGTQMLAKGLDLPKLSLVGIVQAESGLAMPDFRSAERTFQLITQVIGRVGRGHSHGKVIIQSFAPDHPAIKLASKEDFESFYQKELEERKLSLNPPFRYQLKMIGKYPSEDSAERAARALVLEIRSKLKPPLPQIIGPSPAFRERVGNKYQYQVVIKSANREQLVKIVHDHLPTNWTFDLDPLSLL